MECRVGGSGVVSPTAARSTVGQLALLTMTEVADWVRHTGDLSGGFFLHCIPRRCESVLESDRGRRVSAVLQFFCVSCVIVLFTC